MSYRVGQVLYVVLQKQTTVYPMQVVEEITKKTLEGTVTDYVLQAGNQTDKILLKDIQGEVFETPEKTKKVLIERVSKQIERLVETATKKAHEWYPTGTVSHTETIKTPIPNLDQIDPQSSDEDDTPQLELPNGTTVRVKLPEILMNG